MLNWLRWLWNARPILNLGNLLSDDLLCEVAIYVLRNGDRKVFMSRCETQEQIGQSINAILAGAMDLAQQHGIKLRLKQGDKVFEL